MKQLKNYVSLYFPHVMTKYFFCGNFSPFLYVLDIHVTKNDILKPNNKSEFSLSVG